MSISHIYIYIYIWKYPTLGDHFVVILKALGDQLRSVIIYGEHLTFATSVRRTGKPDELVGEYRDSPGYVLGHVDGTVLWDET